MLTLKSIDVPYVLDTSINFPIYSCSLSLLFHKYSIDVSVYTLQLLSICFLLIPHTHTYQSTTNHASKIHTQDNLKSFICFRFVFILFFFSGIGTRYSCGYLMSHLTISVHVCSILFCVVCARSVSCVLHALLPQ